MNDVRLFFYYPYYPIHPPTSMHCRAGHHLMLRTSTKGGMGMKTRANRREKYTIWYMNLPVAYTWGEEEKWVGGWVGGGRTGDLNELLYVGLEEEQAKD